MIGSGETTKDGRKRAIDTMRKEVTSRKVGYCFGFSSDLLFEDATTETGLAKILRAAINRDAAYAVCNSVGLRRIAFNGGMRAVYNGGREILNMTKK